MPKIDQVLIDLVKEEAAKLREALKPEESARLDFDNLQPNNINNCIYGQATGSCNSTRATKLIIKCCSLTYDGKGVQIFKSKLNGAPNKEIIFPSKGISYFEPKRFHFSPIEVFIYRASQTKNKKLIQYLRKETDTLDI